jgi:hypothetical protein
MPQSDRHQLCLHSNSTFHQSFACGEARSQQWEVSVPCEQSNSATQSYPVAQTPPLEHISPSTEQSSSVWQLNAHAPRPIWFCCEHRS